MSTIKDFMLNNGIDLEQIKKDFFETGDKCTESINFSKSYLTVMHNRTKTSFWDIVRDKLEEIDNDIDYTDYQKMMVKASLLLAWEEIDMDNY